MFKKDLAENKKSKYEMDMCSGSVLKKLLLFTVPLIFSSILQLLFNAVDVVVVGKFAGETALAAVSSTGSLINLLTNVFIGLSVGTNVIVARNYAAEKKKDVREAVHTAILLSIISGIFLTIVGVFLAPYLLNFMDVPDTVIGQSSLYLRIYFLGTTAMLIYNFGSAILRAIGDTKRPLFFLMISGVVNLTLNLISVVLLGMGVAGVAIATAVSQCVSAFLIILCLVRETNCVNLNLKKLKIYKDKLIQIIKIGLPAGFQGALFSLSNVVIQSSINSFGDIAMAGSGAAANLEGFVYVTMNSFHQGAISFVGQNIGARKYERINRIVYTALACVAVAGLVTGLIVATFGRPLLGLYTDSPAVVDAGLIRLKHVCAVYFLCGLMDVMVGVLRGMGYSVMPMIVSLVGVCGFRLLWIATIFQLPQYHSIETVYISYMVSWIATFVIHFCCYLVVRHRKKRVWGV